MACLFSGSEPGNAVLWFARSIGGFLFSRDRLPPSPCWLVAFRRHRSWRRCRNGRAPLATMRA